MSVQIAQDVRRIVKAVDEDEERWRLFEPRRLNFGVKEISVALSVGDMRYDATSNFRVARVVGDRRAVIRKVNIEEVAAKFVDAARRFLFFGGEIFAVRVEFADDEVVFERLKHRERDVRIRRDVDDKTVRLEKVGAGFEETKVAVDEELVRLESHFKAFLEFIDAKEPVGRKLDFLLQEMNRETNTIGSKCSDSAIAHTVVEMKSELEKIREQIQNIE